MKVGIRKPSIKKSISAKTTGRAKRAVKKAVVPGYGKKGTGWIKDPKKAAYNKIYNKTTISATKLGSSSKYKSTNTSSYNSNYNTNSHTASHVQYYKNDKRVSLTNSSGKIKNCKIGFSWTNIFFLYFTPLIRLDFKNFLIQFLVLIISSYISEYLVAAAWILFAATYNKQYIKDLIKKGYKASDEYSLNLLIKNKLIFDQTLETTVSYSNEEMTNDTIDILDNNY